MDGGQDFRLTWVNYSQKLTEAFNKFLSRESLCNVTLSANRQTIKAHQAILSACSPWFEEVLMESQHPHPIIIIKDVRYEDLRSIIKFIYTGEVSVPQHELQDFLRTAELLEIKGLLKSPQEEAVPQPPPPPPPPHQAQVQAAFPTATAALMAPLATQPAQATPMPHLSTVPLLLGPATTITDGGIDLVSQIKVPVSLSSPAASVVSPQPQAPQPQQAQSDHHHHHHHHQGLLKTFEPVAKKRKLLGGPAHGLKSLPKQQQQQQQQLVTVSPKKHHPHHHPHPHHHHQHQHQHHHPPPAPQPTTAASAPAPAAPGHQQQQPQPQHQQNGGGPSAPNGLLLVGDEPQGLDATPLLPQAPVADEDSVQGWMSADRVGGHHDANDTDAQDGIEHQHLGDKQPLTAAEVVASGINDCGAFKRLWAERYLCYNLGREIICLLCFCRFTQFKKFNLERHMKNKHEDLYKQSEATRKMILERYVSRYEMHVTPGMVASVPAHGNEHMANEIMAVGPIQLDDLNLDLDVDSNHTSPASLAVTTNSVTSLASSRAIHANGSALSNGRDPIASRAASSSPSGSDKVKAVVDARDRPPTTLTEEDPPGAGVPPEQLIVECELDEPDGSEIVLVKQEKDFPSLD